MSKKNVARGAHSRCVVGARRRRVPGSGAALRVRIAYCTYGRGEQAEKDGRYKRCVPPTIGYAGAVCDSHARAV